MTYSPEQLREDASFWEAEGEHVRTAELRAHADALEELAILKNADVGMMWAQMQEDLRDFDAMKARAERAEAALAEAERG